jgi:hypothetical protein
VLTLFWVARWRYPIARRVPVDRGSRVEILEVGPRDIDVELDRITLRQSPNPFVITGMGSRPVNRTDEMESPPLHPTVAKTAEGLDHRVVALGVPASKKAAD